MCAMHYIYVQILQKDVSLATKINTGCSLLEINKCGSKYHMKNTFCSSKSKKTSHHVCIKNYL